MNETTQVSHPWNANASGQYLLDWQQQRCDEVVADIFGYHSLQWGMPMLQGLRTSRIPHRWLGLDSTDQLALCPSPLHPCHSHPAPEKSASLLNCSAHLIADTRALPLSEASMDLLVLPHTLELSADPHATLREVARVLVPEGKVLIFGLSPWSLWGAQHALERPVVSNLNATRGIAYWRLRDWLQLLELEIETVDFGCFAPYVHQPHWLHRWRWLNHVGAKSWPILGAAYCVLATKRVYGMRLMEPSWRSQRMPAGNAQTVAQRNPSSTNKDVTF